MFPQGGRGQDGGPIAVLVAVIALLTLLGGSKRARRQARRVSGSMGRGAAPVKLVWLIGGFLLFMGLMSLLSSIGSAAAASFGFSLFFCLAPGALLVFLGLAARRARERSGPAAASGSQTDTAQSSQPQQKQPSMAIPAAGQATAAKPSPRLRLGPLSSPNPPKLFASRRPQVLCGTRPTTASGRSATAAGSKA